MAARVIELCEAVKDYINAQKTLGTYSFGFNVIRTNWVSTDLKDTNSTVVYIYPAQPTGSALPQGTRAEFMRQYQVSCHLTNYVDSASQAEIDDALQLAEELERSLENVEMADFSMLEFESTTGGRAFFEIQPAIQRNYYHAIINLTYLNQR